MTDVKKDCNTDSVKKDRGQALSDAHGFVQNHPDAHGFAPGKKPEESDGKWHSSHLDAHGWNHSSTK